MIDIIVPLEQEGTKAVVRGWLKAVGDTVAADDPLVELETDKVTQEVPAPAAGVLAEILLTSEAEAVPGAILGRLRPLGEVAHEAAPATAAAVAAMPASAATATPIIVPTAGLRDPELRLSPSVRRALTDHGLDPATIRGSGKGGRITRADVDAAVAALSTTPATPVASTTPVPSAMPAVPLPAVEARGTPGGRQVPHDRMRRLIAENMVRSVTVAPHVTAVFEADFSAIMAHRAAHKAAFERQGVALTYTAYLVAACVAAMKAVPALNSRWHDDYLELFDDINIGVGTALGDKGLVVPVIHQVQALSLEGIAARLQDVTARARAGKLVPRDVQGGTFSISNHGVSGSLVATPIIIQQPQSAILGVGKLEKRVVVRGVDGSDAMVIRPMAYVSLTIDHRVVDGHQTNAWLGRFVETLETWPR